MNRAFCFAMLVNPRRIVSMIALASSLLACSGPNAATLMSSQTAAIEASAANLHQAYQEAASSPEYAARLTQVGGMTLGAMVGELDQAATGNDLSVDGLKFSGDLSHLHSAAKTLAALDAHYKTIGALWKAIGLDPQAPVSLADFRAGMRLTALANNSASLAGYAPVKTGNGSVDTSTQALIGKMFLVSLALQVRSRQHAQLALDALPPGPRPSVAAGPLGSAPFGDGCQTGQTSGCYRPLTIAGVRAWALTTTDSLTHQTDQSGAVQAADGSWISLSTSTQAGGSSGSATITDAKGTTAWTMSGCTQWDQTNPNICTSWATTSDGQWNSEQSTNGVPNPPQTQTVPGTATGKPHDEL